MTKWLNLLSPQHNIHFCASNFVWNFGVFKQPPSYGFGSHVQKSYSHYRGCLEDNFRHYSQFFLQIFTIIRFLNIIPVSVPHARLLTDWLLCGDAENARNELAGHENAAPVVGLVGLVRLLLAPYCRGGKCETWKCGTILQGWKMREKLVWKAKVWKSVSK